MTVRSPKPPSPQIPLKSRPRPEVTVTPAERRRAKRRETQSWPECRPRGLHPVGGTISTSTKILNACILWPNCSSSRWIVSGATHGHRWVIAKRRAEASCPFRAWTKKAVGRQQSSVQTGKRVGSIYTGLHQKAHPAGLWEERAEKRRQKIQNRVVVKNLGSGPGLGGDSNFSTISCGISNLLTNSLPFAL